MSIPEGTPITFYTNDPSLFGHIPLLTWQTPCTITQGSTEIYTISIPLTHAAPIYAVLNDSGESISPIKFPITDIEEYSYVNNVDNESVCLEEGAIVRATKFTNTPAPICSSLVNYTINVCNISQINAFDVSVTDISPAEFNLVGSIFFDNGCTENQDGTYDIPAECCFALSVTYNTSSASIGNYNDQDVILSGPEDQTYIDFDGETTSDEDVIINGTIDCPSTNIEFEKSVNVEEICDNQVVQFGYTIKNDLNMPLQGLVITDTLPEPCAWIFEPYSELELSIGTVEVNQNILIISINQVNANTEATFRMDVQLGSWSLDGTMESSAHMDNIIDVEHNNYKSIGSNITTTNVTVSPSSEIWDTIAITNDLDIVLLDALLQGEAEIAWTTNGDGVFTDSESEITNYILGNSDLTNEIIILQLTLNSDCGKTFKSVVIKRLEEALDTEESLRIDDKVAVFPNPATERIFFKSQEKRTLQKIKIFNTVGQCLIAAEKNTSHTELSIDILKAGVYFYMVETDEGEHHGKFLKI